MASFYHYRTPFGIVAIGCDEGVLTHVALGAKELPGVFQPCALSNEAANQLQEYLAGKRRLFDLPLKPSGTPFQLQVWDAPQFIPYGQTRSYSEVAASIGRPSSSRAVGQAVKANPLAIVIPCHRVLPADGSLGGYAYGPRTKAFLLDLESRTLSAGFGG